MNWDFSIGTLLLLRTLHWLADFVLQTDAQAKAKSKDWGVLFDHALAYTLTLALGVAGYRYHEDLVVLPGIGFFMWFTFVCHFVTDAVTSRINARLWAKGEVHNLFISVDFDQLLHYVQLLVTYKLCFPS